MEGKSFLMFLKVKYFQKEQGKGLKMLTPKQMIKSLSVALEQVKAGNNSENSLNEIKSDKLFIHCINQKK